MADLIGRQRRIGFRRRSHWRHWRRAYLQCLVGERIRERTRKRKRQPSYFQNGSSPAGKTCRPSSWLISVVNVLLLYGAARQHAVFWLHQQWRTLVAFLSLAGQPQLEPHMGPNQPRDRRKGQLWLGRPTCRTPVLERVPIKEGRGMPNLPGMLGGLTFCVCLFSNIRWLKVPGPSSSTNVPC